MGESNTVGLLIQEGWRRSMELHRYLTDRPESPALTWSPRILFLALLSTCTQTAKFTGMERQDFLALCSNFYDNVDVGVGQAAAEREGTDEEG